MRISSSQIFQRGIDAIQSQQQSLFKVQQQLSTGKRILTPADDPSGAVQGLQYRTSIAATDQYQRNADLAEQRLRVEEFALDGTTDSLHRIWELTVAGNNGTQTDETRKAIAAEIRERLDELIDLANTRDANGEYIFAGFQSQTQPFVKDTGGVQYQGDNGQRFLQVSPVRQVPIGDPGDDMFMNIQNGNGTFQFAATQTNAGTSVMELGAVTDGTAWAAGLGAGPPYTLEFANDGGSLSYRVLDNTSTEVIAPTPYESGDVLDLASLGIQVTVKGTPADGDTYTIEPSQNESLFSMVQGIIDTLETPAPDSISRARLHNQLTMSLANLDQATRHISETHAALGGRMNNLDTLSNLNADSVLQMEATLSSIEDLDYADAISRFQFQLASLQAAQQTYVQVNRLSLFDYL
jgi:flagellar hook-associated protein 3 FlgL